jgi:hypothetical protein
MLCQGTLSLGLFLWPWTQVDTGKKKSHAQHIPLGSIGMDKQAQSVLPRTPPVN